MPFCVWSKVTISKEKLVSLLLAAIFLVQNLEEETKYLIWSLGRAENANIFGISWQKQPVHTNSCFSLKVILTSLKLIISPRTRGHLETSKNKFPTSLVLVSLCE